MVQFLQIILHKLDRQAVNNYIYTEGPVWWLMHVIPATWEAKIAKIVIHGQAGHEASKTCHN
jgi:hypothetical protein